MGFSSRWRLIYDCHKDSTIAVALSVDQPAADWVPTRRDRRICHQRRLWECPKLG